MPHRLTEAAEKELDAIWEYVAAQSASATIANALIHRLTRTFFMLAEHPYMGRRRDDDLRPGLRSFPVDAYIVIYRVEENHDVTILLATRGARDVRELFKDEI